MNGGLALCRDVQMDVMPVDVVFFFIASYIVRQISFWIDNN